MAESSSRRVETEWEKQKLLLTSNFSFSHNVFKDLDKFDKNDKRLSIWVENTVGKAEFTPYEQFLLFP